MHMSQTETCHSRSRLQSCPPTLPLHRTIHLATYDWGCILCFWCNKAAIHVVPLCTYFKDGPRANASLSSNDFKAVRIIQILDDLDFGHCQRSFLLPDDIHFSPFAAISLRFATRRGYTEDLKVLYHKRWVEAQCETSVTYSLVRQVAKFKTIVMKVRENTAPVAYWEKQGPSVDSNVILVFNS